MSDVSRLNFRRCPIELSIDQLGRKWAMPIVRDLFNGKTRFKEFLEANPEMSAKMLSTRLRDLQEFGVIEKKVVMTTPLLIEYGLTEKGRALGDILYSLAVFSMRFQPDEVFDGPPGNAEEELRRIFLTPI
ncbi:MAG: helix-turn-helix transcriptional regulator [Candidatus Bathyarchaeota archaeon]|nr:MAG: helix-turn-helix transcriptional regulator [Candidatus Bathyarchaeota archaeon]